MMRIFILVSFWLFVLTIFLRVIVLMGSDYPRTQTYKLGTDIVRLLEAIGFAIWAAIVLWIT